jgi:hypothetical protein
MIYDVYNGVPAIEGDGGQRIGIGTNCPSVRIYIGESSASYASDTVGIGNNTPSCRFEVQSDGVVGVERKGI